MTISFFMGLLTHSLFSHAKSSTTSVLVICPILLCKSVSSNNFKCYWLSEMLVDIISGLFRQQAITELVTMNGCANVLTRCQICILSEFYQNQFVSPCQCQNIPSKLTVDLVYKKLSAYIQTNRKGINFRSDSHFIQPLRGN